MSRKLLAHQPALEWRWMQPVEEHEQERHPDTAQAAAELIDFLMRGVESHASDSKLSPARWAALRFFALANPGARTVMGFAEAHRSSKGTAAQTIGALTRAGYLVSTPLSGRSARYDLTDAGRAVLDADPLNRLAQAIRDLPPQQQASLIDTLIKLAAKDAAAISRSQKVWSAQARDDQPP